MEKRKRESNCEMVQRYLLALERVESPAETVRAHLSRCLPCQEHHARLLRLESDLRTLPRPESDAKATFLRQFRTPARPQEKTGTQQRWQVRERGHRKLALAFALAAALVLFAVGIWVTPRWMRTSPPADPTTPTIAEVVREREPKLDQAETPAQRLAIYSDVCSTVLDEVSNLRGQQLIDLAKLHERIVLEGIVAEARSLKTLPVEVRREKLEPIIVQLEVEGARAARLADVRSEAESFELRRLASVARQGASELRLLLNAA